MALVGQGLGHDLPGAVLGPDAPLGGHLDRVEMNLVELVAVERRQRIHGDPRRAQVDDQQREPAAAALLRPGSAQEPQVVHVLGVGLPALLAGHHVGVAAKLGAAAHRGEIGAGLGLRVAEREVELAASDRRQPALLLLLGSVARDGLRDDSRGERVARGARVGHLVPQDVLAGERVAGSAPFDGPADREPALRAHGAEEFAHLLPLVSLTEEAVEVAVVGEELDDLGAKGLVLLGEAEVHESSSTRAFGSGFQRGSRFSAKARGPSRKSGCPQCSRSRPQADSRASE